MLLHGSSYLFMRTILNIVIRCLSFGRFIDRLIMTIFTVVFAYGHYYKLKNKTALLNLQLSFSVS
jgi:hypothetical protein